MIVSELAIGKFTLRDYALLQYTHLADIFLLLCPTQYGAALVKPAYSITKRLAFTLMAITFLLLNNGLRAETRKIPVEDFFKNPQFAQIQISPNGRFLAALAPYKGRRNIVVMETNHLRKAKAVTDLEDYDIAGFLWGNDNRIIFTVDKEGREAFALYAVDREGGRVKTLVESMVSIGARAVRSASIVDRLPSDPDHVIVSYNKRRVQAPDLYKLNINNGKLTLIGKNTGSVIKSVLDRSGHLRIISEIEGTTQTIRYRDNKDEEWKTLFTTSTIDKNIQPLAFDFDNKTLYVSSNKDRDTLAIYRYDLLNNKLGNLLFEQSNNDVSGALFSFAKKKLIGFEWEDEKPQILFIDDEWRKLQESIDNAFPGKIARVSSVSDDERLAVITTFSDTSPPQYYLLDRDSNKVKFLASSRNWIKEEEMAPMTPIQYLSRDGLTIHGYLTLPKEYKAGRIPLIINPHGGPFGIRDSWGFNPEHQLFANRGYATLQMNFRGSGGYGHTFETAGYRQWGRKMQNDITDAVDWAIDKGFANPKRVCIYGISYGGYAAMAGLTFTPELYKCGINYVGVTDVKLLFDTMPKAWKLLEETMKEQIGAPDDKKFMRDISPLHHIQNLRAPLLIIHGKQDPRVNIKHATKLRAQMEKFDKPYEWLVKKKEGHGFKGEKNRIEAYKKIDSFLANAMKH